MKWLILTVVTIAALLVVMMVAPNVIGDKGYVLIAMGDWTIEMTVVSLLITVFVAIIAWIVLKYLLSRVFLLFKGSHHWFGSWSQRKRKRAFYRGFQALAEGDVKDAKNAFNHTTDGDFDGVNYLAAAHVARQLDELERMRVLLEKAAEYRHSRLAAHLVLARLHMEQEHPQLALERLEALDEAKQRNTQVILLKTQAMARLGQWQQLEENLPKWKRALGEDYIPWAQRVAKGKFAEIASKQGANQLKQYWQELPRKYRHDDAYRAAYIQQLMDQGMHSDAQDHLVEWQKKQPNAALMPLFNQLNLPDPSPSIRLFEGWIKENPSHASLYSTLGHIAFNAGDDVLAEKALMKSVKLSQNKEDLLLLAAINERRNDSAQALSLYKQGLATGS